MRVRRFLGARVAAVTLAAALALGACGGATSPKESPGGQRPEPGARASEPVQSTEVPWPTASPSALGFAPARLRALARRTKRMDSSCLAVVRDGTLVGQWDWGMAATAPREVFSITKSVTSALVGIAVRDGSLSLDDRVSTYVPEWLGTPSARVTVRNLLSNDSGRFWSQDTDYVALLQATDRTAYAIGLSQTHPPGTVWAYNNAAIQVLEAVLRKSTGRPVAEFAAERLFEPLGMTSSRMSLDTSGHAQTFFGAQSTCLDLARFAMLYLDDGKVDDTRVLSRDYVRASIGRPSTDLNASYGLLWWLNRTGTVRGSTDAVDDRGQPVRAVVGQLAPTAPDDAFAAQGLGGQTVFVDPGSRVVVVRLGGLGGSSPYNSSTAARVLTALR